MRLRRNDVVDVGGATGWFVPGRVVSRIDDSHVRVIDVFKHDKVYRDEDVEKVDYRGCYRYGRGPETPFPIFDRMPTLRRLKQQRSFYDKSVWKRHTNK